MNMILNKNKKYLRFMLAVLPLAFVGKFVHAASECVSGSGGYCVNLAAVAQAQGIPGLEFLPATSDFGELISNIYVFGMGLVAISALVVLVAAGVWYMSAGDNAGRAGEAKKWMGNAIFGLVLALLSWLILYTINPNFVAKPNWVQNLQKIDDAAPTDPTAIQRGGAVRPIATTQTPCGYTNQSNCTSDPACQWNVVAGRSAGCISRDTAPIGQIPRGAQCSGSGDTRCVSGTSCNLTCSGTARNVSSCPGWIRGQNYYTCR